jgi:hypothetical protein
MRITSPGTQGRGMRAQRRAAASDARVISVPARPRAALEGRGAGGTAEAARSPQLTPEGQPGRFTRPGPDRSGRR